MEIVLSETSVRIAGILFLALVTVETGGMYLVKLVRGGADATAFQLSFARAGHAHAGVLLVLALVGLLYADAAGLDGLWGVIGRSAIPIAALLMPGGFYFSSMGAGRSEPNRLIVLVWIGAATLATGLTALGLGLLLGT